VFGDASDAVLFRADREPRLVDLDENETATLKLHERDHGAPKGVQLTHRNLWMNATTFGWHAGVSDRDCFLHVVPTFQLAMGGDAVRLAAMGVPQVILRKVSGARSSAAVEAHGVTFWVPRRRSSRGARCRQGCDPVPGRGRAGSSLQVRRRRPGHRARRARARLEFIQLYGSRRPRP